MAGCLSDPAPLLAAGSPAAPRPRGEGRWGGGGGRGVEHPPAPAWAGCRRQLCTQEPVRKRAGIQELPRETLPDALYAPRDLLPPLLCSTPGCLTCPWVPPSPLAESF